MHGPVAQLGERLVCIQEVVGSIPVGSTRLDDRERLFRGRVASAGFPREQRGPGGHGERSEQAVTPDSIGAYSSVWLERTPDKREVGGSNPPRPTIKCCEASVFEENT